MPFILGNKQHMLAFTYVFGSVLLKMEREPLGRVLDWKWGTWVLLLVLPETHSPYLPQVPFGANSLCSGSAHTKPSAHGDWLA